MAQSFTVCGCGRFRDLTIGASALPGGIQINGNTNGRIFQVEFFHSVVLDSLTITNGKITAP